MSETPFENLNDALDVHYDTNELVEKAEKNITALSETKQDVVEDLEDKEYMEMELKMLIQESQFVMEKLKEECKIGAKPRVFEVYSTMTRSVLDAIKELRELHTTIERLKLDKEKLAVKRLSIDSEGNIGAPKVNLQLTGKDLFKMVEEAQKSAAKKQQEINAEYKVEDD